jgi:hypothetical protein
MPVPRLIAPAAISLLATLGSASATGFARPDSPGVAVAASRGENIDGVGRVRAHFDSVLVELGARDLRQLAPGQRRNRATLIATLRAYSGRGEFPHNYDFPGQAVPYFVDRKTGTLCAVAYLLESTGRRDIVDRVAKANNNVRVPELAGDTALARWLDASGLTLAEAARIQVPYMGPAQPAAPVRASQAPATVAAPYALGSAALAGAWNAFVNIDGHRRSATVLGLATGAVAMGTGLAVLARSGAPRGLGAASAVVGGMGALLATRSFARHRSAVAAAGAGAREITVAPFVSGGRDGATGVSVAIRF